MCTEIGVDPLASSKGFWAEMLGVGDFYYELAVQAVEVCMGMRAETGGLVDLEIVKAKIGKMRSTGDKNVSITDDDVHRAIETLRPLSSGYQIITMGKRKMVQSVPREMSDDQSDFSINAASEEGFVSNKTREELKWTEERFSHAVNSLVSEGIVWIDEHAGSTTYWLPGLFSQL